MEKSWNCVFGISVGTLNYKNDCGLCCFICLLIVMEYFLTTDCGTV